MASGAYQGSVWTLVVQCRTAGCWKLLSESSAGTGNAAMHCWQGDMAGCRPAERRKGREGPTLDAEQQTARKGCRRCRLAGQTETEGEGRLECGRPQLGMQ